MSDLENLAANITKMTQDGTLVNVGDPKLLAMLRRRHDFRRWSSRSS